MKILKVQDKNGNSPFSLALAENGLGMALIVQKLLLMTDLHYYLSW